MSEFRYNVNDPIQWPDLRKDRDAWEQAVSELPDAPLSTVLQRAQQIKDAH